MANRFAFTGEFNTAMLVYLYLDIFCISSLEWSYMYIAFGQMVIHCIWSNGHTLHLVKWSYIAFGQMVIHCIWSNGHTLHLVKLNLIEVS